MTYDWIAVYLGTGLYTHPLTIKSREIVVLDRANFNIPYHGESSLVLKAYSITALPKVSLVPRHLSRVYFTEGEVKGLNRLAWAWVNIGSHGIFSEGDNSCVDICSILFEMECPPHVLQRLGILNWTGSIARFREEGCGKHWPINGLISWCHESYQGSGRQYLHTWVDLHLLA